VTVKEPERQRTEALEKANAVRFAKARIKREVAAMSHREGLLFWADYVERVEDPLPFSLQEMLASVHYVGHSKARRILGDVDRTMSADVKLTALTDRRKERLVKALRTATHKARFQAHQRAALVALDAAGDANGWAYADEVGWEMMNLVGGNWPPISAAAVLTCLRKTEGNPVESGRGVRRPSGRTRYRLTDKGRELVAEFKAPAPVEWAAVPVTEAEDEAWAERLS
jgi:hypothetical protein